MWRNACAKHESDKHSSISSTKLSSVKLFFKMVNGNYVLYGDRPSSESEVVEDHVHHARTAERKSKRKTNRTANELQQSLNMAQLDNETDSVKYEKKVKEPRLLRYVPTTDVEENFVNDKFETYDLKPTDMPPRRYAFTKKPKNPADGSVNYAYSRSSSSCSSPTGNLPTISEHGEQFGTYRARAPPSPTVSDIVNGYENKFDKYFAKPRQIKKFPAKGTHPDSLYRVQANSSAGAGKLGRALRLLRWPVALVTVCVALAVFVYFLMPNNMKSELNTVNGTYWEASVANTKSHRGPDKPGHKPPENTKKNKGTERTRTHELGTKTSEIDFYQTENDENVDFTSVMDTTTENTPKRKLPIPPVFPTHLTPEVQYGNEKADSKKLRSPKLLEVTNEVPEDSTLKPHITQKPEKPLAIYFKDGDGITTTASTESITRAETINDFTNYNEKQTTKKIEASPSKSFTPAHKERMISLHQNESIKNPNINSEDYKETEEYYKRRPVKADVSFTSGHSKLFGISIEDAEKMKATTQSSLYNTRVSPTLPTWRDGDDATTKKYPINFNTDVPQCRSTRLPLCRGILPYDLAAATTKVDGVDISSLLPQIEYVVSTNCSSRMRQFVCALLEPECNPLPYPIKMPCRNLCRAIVDSCEGMIARELRPMFKCSNYLSSNCVAARTPCHQREFACGDGTCIPRDWICDGTYDCYEGQDEASCVKCEQNEYKCHSGGCILKRWMCDGYADCSGGEDEAEEACESRGVRVGGESGGELGNEPGSEPAGSAPAPAVRRPGHRPGASKHRTGENDNSKELLVTSDSNNALKRNFTRRPSLSRLTPYSRPMLHEYAQGDKTTRDQSEKRKSPAMREFQTENIQKLAKGNEMNYTAETKRESGETINMEDLGFFEELEKEDKEHIEKKGGEQQKSMQRIKANMRKPLTETASTGAAPVPPRTSQSLATAPAPPAPPAPLAAHAHLDKSINKLERVIDGAALLKKATDNALPAADYDSYEKNSTHSVEDDTFPGGRGTGEAAAISAGAARGVGGAGGARGGGGDGLVSAHASPCPSGELRCVDGRCITLAQLCDGTIDCADHADEDNCYT